MDDKFYSFKKAREYVLTLNLKGLEEWIQYTKSNNFPDFLPKQPEQVYKEEWTGFGNWLNITRTISTRSDFLSFEEARDYVRSLKLKGRKEWLFWAKTKPDNIPTTPNLVYRDDWINLADWLGTVQEE